MFCEIPVARTSRLRIGSGARLLPKPDNHPVRTAESVAMLGETLDEEVMSSNEGVGEYVIPELDRWLRERRIGRPTGGGADGDRRLGGE
jgi:hypothetical protein